MATPKFNSKSPTIKRILREASELASSPSPFFHASPASDSDLFDWHFTLRGPPSSAYSTGIYHGRIVLPPSYPLRPPSFRFLTPTGRFEVNREICLSISGHHEETWMPAWGLRTALTALRAFMETDAKGQLGGLESSMGERERIAGLSKGWKCSGCGRSNGSILEEARERAREMGTLEGEDVEVPEELKMAYKDEMKNGTEQHPDRGLDNDLDGKLDLSDEEADLAEGFVQTGLDGAGDTHHEGPPAAPTPTPTYPAARPAQSVPQPTGAVQDAQRIQRAPVPPRIANAGVPIWIDRLIAAIVVLLVALVLKVLLGI